MAKTTTQPMSPFAMGEDPESALANQAYKEAMDKLLQTYEARNEKPFFDPKMLSLAQAFAKPTQTGDFFESLGNVAGSLQKSQQDEQTKAEDLARMRLELAGMGVNQAQQQSTMQTLRQRAAPPAEGPVARQPSGALPGMPAGEPSAAPAVAAESVPFSIGPEERPLQPSPFEGMNIIGKFQPPTGLIKTEQEFYQRAIRSGQRDPVEIDKGWFQYQKDNLAPRYEGGQVFDPRTGVIYGKDVGATGTVSFMTNQGGDYTLPERNVREHQGLIEDARRDPNNPEVWNKLQRFEDFYRKGRPSIMQAVPNPAIKVNPYSIEAQQAAAQPAVPPAVPLATATPAGGMQSAQQRERAKAKEASELAVQQALAIEEGKAKIGAGLGAEARFAETIGGKRGEAAVAEETRIAQNAQNAGKLFTAADTVINSVKESPNYFGVFNKPGALNAIGSTLAEVGKPGGRFTLLDVEAQVVKLMPGTTTKNLLDREKAASALAEIELGYTQTYLAKQGAVTEGERRIVRAIPGGLSSSPQFLELKGKLIKERAQYDININTAYSEYLKVNPRGNALDFQRNSPLYKEIHSAFEKETAKLAGTTPALPTKERQNSGPAKSNAASSYVEDLLKRRGQQ